MLHGAEAAKSSDCAVAEEKILGRILAMALESDGSAGFARRAVEALIEATPWLAGRRGRIALSDADDAEGALQVGGALGKAEEPQSGPRREMRFPIETHDATLGALLLEWDGGAPMSAAQSAFIGRALSAIALGLASRRQNDASIQFFEMAVEPLCIIGFDGRMRRANRAWEDVLGWSVQELLAMEATDLIHAEDTERAHRALRNVRAGEPLRRHIVRCRHKDGCYRWLEWSATGASGQILAQVRDVTDEERRRSHYEAIERATGIGGWEVDLDTQQLYWTPAIYELYGLQAGGWEPQLKDAITCYRPDARPQIIAAVDELRTKGTPYTLTLPFIARDGTERWRRLTGTAEMRDGKVIRVLGTSQDVTEQRRHQQHVRRLSEVAERTTNSVVITDAERRIIWVNPAFTRRTGFSLEEIRGRRPRETYISLGSDLEALRRVGEAVEAGRGMKYEMQWRDKEGRDLWVETDLQSFVDDEGVHAGFIAISTDITERKVYEAQVEAARREAQTARERLTLAIETLPDGFALFGGDDRLVLCNRRYREIYAKSADAMVPGASFEHILRVGLARGQYADALGREEEWLAERLAAHRRRDLSVEQKLADGRWLRIVERETPEGGYVGLRIDITELKRQEAALRASNLELQAALNRRDQAERRFSDIAAVSNDWFWEQDENLRFTFISDSFARSGCDPARVIGRKREEVFHLRDNAESLGRAFVAARTAGQAAAVRQRGLSREHHRGRRAVGAHQRRPVLPRRRHVRGLSRRRVGRHAALPGDAARRGGKSGQVAVPGDDEPRDPHAAQRRAGHGRRAAADRGRPRAGPAGGDDP